MELASKSQAINGVDNKTYMSPLRVKQSIQANMNYSTASGNYNDLSNKPKINGITLEGNISSSDLGIDADKSYVYAQNIPSSTWDITHNMGKYPSVTVIDSAGSVVIGEVTYKSTSQLAVTFTSSFSGKAYLN